MVHGVDLGFPPRLKNCKSRAASLDTWRVPGRRATRFGAGMPRMGNPGARVAGALRDAARRMIGTARPRAAGRAGALARRTETCFNLRVEERARRIVETAVELAEEGGFDAVRLRDVASNAGVALGTLYRRFRSKEDLLVAALEQELEDVEARLASRPPRGETAEARVGAFFQMTTRAMCRRPNLSRAMLRAVASGEPELTQKVAAFHGRLAALVAAALGGAVRGPAPGDQEQRIAQVLSQVWFASLVGWAGGLHGQAAVVEQTRSAAELLLRP